MDNVLIVKLGALGDILLSEGTIRDIREHHPDARISVLTGRAYRRLFERCPWVDEIITDDRAPRWRLDRMWRLRDRLRQGRFNVVYDLQRSRRSRFYRHWMLSDVPWPVDDARIEGVSIGDGQRPTTVPQFNARRLKALGIPTRHSLHPDPRWMADDVSTLLDRAELADGYIVLLPGSSARHPQKRWPHYAALAEQLIADDHVVVTVPGPDEIALCRTLPGVMLTGDSYLDFFSLAGVLGRAAFVVGNDSGPTHLAAHLGVPGLALFGSHAPAKGTGIERDRFGVIEVRDLSELSVDRVYGEVRSRLIGLTEANCCDH